MGCGAVLVSERTPQFMQPAARTTALPAPHSTLGRNMLCMTYAVVITITILVYETVIPRREASEIAVGLTLSAMTLLFLSLTAFSDPGIFPKHTRPKVHSLLQPGTYVCGVAVALSLT